MRDHERSLQGIVAITEPASWYQLLIRGQAQPMALPERSPIKPSMVRIRSPVRSGSITAATGCSRHQARGHNGCVVSEDYKTTHKMSRASRAQSYHYATLPKHPHTGVVHSYRNLLIHHDRHKPKRFVQSSPTHQRLIKGIIEVTRDRTCQH